MDDIKLTPKQQAFCDYYIETGNATQSALRAGYKCGECGRENLQKPTIKAYIEQRTSKSKNERIATGDEVLMYLTAVMRGEVKDQFELDASLTDRNRAAEMLGKRYGLFREKLEVSADKEKEDALKNLAEIAGKMQ